jgi:hypothetical protein
LLDCDKEEYGGDNYGCIGGWMYQGFQFVSKFGLLHKKDYNQYSQGDKVCSYIAGKTKPERKTYMKGIGYMEHDRRNNK